jgi:hypothetical protein
MDETLAPTQTGGLLHRVGLFLNRCRFWDIFSGLWPVCFGSNWPVKH